MTTLTFIYSLPPAYTIDSGNAISSPYTITQRLGRFLRDQAAARGWAFRYQNLDDPEVYDYSADDIVIGHTQYPDGAMNRALESRAGLKFILQPYTHHWVAQGEVGWMKGLMDKADHLFLITGNYWWSAMEHTTYADYQANATRVDMAVDAADHAYAKRSWGAPGQRGVLCLGTDLPVKGLRHVARLAQMGNMRLGYCGSADPMTFQHVARFVHHGGVVFSPDNIARICRDYDFFVTMGEADANPTTLLEASAWGLIAFATETSGYTRGLPFVELRLDDWAYNLEVMDAWQHKNTYDLQTYSSQRRALIEQIFTWEKFCSTVWSGMERFL